MSAPVNRSVFHSRTCYEPGHRIIFSHRRHIAEQFHQHIAPRQSVETEPAGFDIRFTGDALEAFGVAEYVSGRRVLPTQIRPHDANANRRQGIFAKEN